MAGVKVANLTEGTGPELAEGEAVVVAVPILLFSTYRIQFVAELQLGTDLLAREGRTQDDGRWERLWMTLGMGSFGF